MPTKNYYDTLGVPKTATGEEIKSKYRKLAKQYHPDVNKDPAAVQKFKEINEAYEVLGDDTKRKNYDQYGDANGANPFGGGGANAGGGAGGFGGFGGAFGGGSPFGNGGAFGGFEDIFNMFGGGFGGGRQAAQTVAGEDIVTRLTLLFEEAVFGCEKTVKINRIAKCESCKGTGAKNGTAYDTCSDCGGRGRVRYQQDTIFGRVINEGPCKKCNGTGKIIREKCEHCGGHGTKAHQEDVKIKIPGGIDDTQVLTVHGRGHASPSQNGPSGDLLIEVTVRPHEILTRDKFNLYLELPVPFTLAYLGGTVKVPLTKGTYNLEIPPLTQPNTVFKLKNKGVKYLNKDNYGDLIVTLRVEMPKSASRQDKEIMERLNSQIAEKEYPKNRNYNEKMSSFK